ncbi:allantoinase-like [Aricia agestis]|uniref:allantoinase-like n=1 Tax=Aricia agestis TaxID=91739 RepID=UPI001C206BC5|nr:allantoinase-like [Aricia agestis]
MRRLCILGIILILAAAITCRGLLKKDRKRRLFLSRHVVTETTEFDGGVLVDAEGVIEGVLSRAIIDDVLSEEHSLEIIDGGDLALMAGAIDSHVHVNEPGRTSWEGYVTATRAAAVGGFTTIVDMPLNSIPPTTTLKNFRTKAFAAREEVYVDVAFWGGVIPDNEPELQQLMEAGVVGFKGFLIDSGVSEFPNVMPDELEKVFNVLNGTDTVLAFHAEKALNNSESCSCKDPTLYSTYLDTHPPEMELDAVSLVASYIPYYDVHVHIVHVSAEGVIPILEAARAKRIAANSKRWRGGVTAETCHHYLSLSSEQIPPGHTEYKCAPPIRNITNKNKLWQYIKERRIDLIASDHSPTVVENKTPNFLTAWGGVSSVQFGLSLFWTEARARGYNLSTVSHFLSSGPAHLAGLQDKKGAIKPGLDADLIYFDPNASFIVTPEIIVYKNKLSPYMNRVLTGKVIHTYLRGQLIYSNGELVEQPAGKLLVNETVLFGF